MSSPGSRALLSVPLLALLALACASAGGAPRTGGDDFARVALAPLNLGVGHADDLAEAEETVEQELVRFLRERGAHVGIVHAGDAQRAWLAAASTQEGEADPARRLDATAAAFVLALRQESDFEFDYVLLPSVVYRDARIFGRIASWDGVRRRVKSRRASGASQDHYFREWEGEITGLSLHVWVYEPDGERVYQGWGGLDLTHDPVAVGAAMAARPIPQANILANPEHVREGVGLALRPYVGDARR